MSKFKSESALKKMKKDELIEYVMRLQEENSLVRTRNNELRVKISFEREDRRINQQLGMF